MVVVFMIFAALWRILALCKFEVSEKTSIGFANLNINLKICSSKANRMGEKKLRTPYQPLQQLWQTGRRDSPSQ
jgi:hypothetical protein